MPLQKMRRPLYFGLLDHVAAKDRDRGLGIEGGEIDRGFHFVDRLLVLGIEEARMAEGDERRLAAPLDRRRFHLERAAREELRQPRERFLPRQQHGVAEMHSGARVFEHARQKNSLIDLDAVLVLLRMLGFRRDLRRRRRQPRNQRGRVEDEPLDADEIGVVLGERAIKFFRVTEHESVARRAADPKHQFGGAFFLGVARGLLRKGREQIRADLPEAGKGLAVALEIGARARPRREPGGDDVAGKARRHEAARGRPDVRLQSRVVASLDRVFAWGLSGA